MGGTVDSPRTVNIIVVDGVEGPSIYWDNYRVAGNKPWGGGSVIHEWAATWDDIGRALKIIGGTVPTVDEMLGAFCDGANQLVGHAAYQRQDAELAAGIEAVHALLIAQLGR